MRTGTILLLLGAVLLFAFFGWKAFGVLALSVLAFLLLALLIVAWALWRVKVRVRRTMESVARDLEARLRAAGARPPSDPNAPNAPDVPFGGGSRRDAIDVEGRVRKPRDGADDPDQLDPDPPR